MASTLILCIDRDNDLYEKAGINGPVIGREANLKAATALALVDPEDVDSNTIFSAIKLYGELKKEKQDVEVITLTGHKSLGYKSDRAVSKQLDKLVKEMGATSCVLVTDGASDEEVIPIIKSRLKIDSTKIVYIKQAKELEKTYFVILEKLRDPYYARIILGIPATLILLASISSFFGFGWQPVGIIIGLYLIIKGFSLDETFSDFFESLDFSFEKPSWIANVSAIFLFLVAVIVTFYSHTTALRLSLFGEKLYAYVIYNITPIILFAALLIMVGKAINAFSEKKKFAITNYATYAVAFVLLALVIRTGSDWILNFREPYVSFGDLLFVMVVSLIVAYSSIKLMMFIRSKSLLSLKLEGREVINQYGSLIGRIVGVDGKHGTFIIQNIFNKKITIGFDDVYSISDQVIIKGFI